jgi:Uncharacterised protein family (UPF0236)
VSSPLKKTALVAGFAAELHQELHTWIDRQSLEELDFEALEMTARRAALHLAGRLIERFLNAEESDHDTPQQQCHCGQLARYAGRRSKSIQTALGELRLNRAYYHCSHCNSGFAPRDRTLGIEHSSLSPAVLRMIGTVGAMMSFQEGSALLKELGGIDIDAKQVERWAEKLGAEIAEDETQNSTAMESQPVAPTLYLGLDGTGIPMRSSELKGRPGKQADGTAKTREVKLCTVWSAESRDEQNRPVRDAGSVTYSAAIESAATLDCAKLASPFSQRVLREASRRRFIEASRMVVIGDGAAWIWSICQELFPRAVQIVDRFHVKEHLSNLSKTIYGASSPKAKAWAERRHEELDSGRFAELLEAVRRHADAIEEARQCFQYLHRNRERMRYPQFEANGLCTSSGVVEAGCKVVVGTRLKRAGMHWTVSGSNAIIALRCSKLSGRFQDYWERRSERRAA